jgi:hypothetical protein
VPSTQGDDDRQRFYDRCFEFLKHITTLSTASALIILAIYREAPFRERLLAVTFLLLGICLVNSVFGMLGIAVGSGKHAIDPIHLSEETLDGLTRFITTNSGVTFTGSIIAFALVILEVPFGRTLAWILLAAYALLVLLLTGAFLYGRRRGERQPSTDKPPEPEQDGERPS